MKANPRADAETMDERCGALPTLGQLEPGFVVFISGYEPVKEKTLNLSRNGILRESRVKLSGIAFESDDDIAA